MPTYGYQCEKCGHHLEVIQKMSDEPLKTCPSCHSDSLRKRMYPVGVVFKGSGFYKTDYASKSSGGGESKSSSSDSSSSSASAPSTESKPSASESKSEKKSD